MSASSATHLDDEWLSFLNNGVLQTTESLLSLNSDKTSDVPLVERHGPPLAQGDETHEHERTSTLHISTKTQIVKLSTTFVLSKLFWTFRVQEYYLPQQGVLKKQMRFTFRTVADLETYIKNRDQEYTYRETVVSHSEEDGVFHGQRMLNVGLCKKDILIANKHKQTEKGAFCNCVVVVLRIYMDTEYIEVHVKIFESGKLEIPGIKDDRVVHVAVKYLTQLINANASVCESICECQHVVPTYHIENVLINSNFNCGYAIRREALYRIIKSKYRLTCNYDPCSYPGIQCKYFHYADSSKTYLSDGGQFLGQKHSDHPQCKKNMHRVGVYCISFFIFRTGSVLIVGRCTESILHHIFRFIIKILDVERANIEMKESTETKHTHVLQSKTKRGKLVENGALGRVVTFRTKQTI